MRTLPVLLLAVGVFASLSLTSCATAPFSETCESTTSSGPASDLVTATGDFGTAPTVTFPTPIVTNTIERTELITGTGPKVSAGDLVLVNYTMMSGDSAQGSEYTSAPGPIALTDKTAPALTKGLQCATVGSRVAIVSSAIDVGLDPASFPESIVLVVDIVDAFPSKAYGVPQIPQAGMPAVVTAPDGTPGITVPKNDPPTALTVNALQHADGQKVNAGDNVVVKYTALLWSSRSVFYSTWKDGNAHLITLSQPATPPGTPGTPTEGLIKGLIGQNVGSQVLIVVPSEQGFGSDSIQSVPGGSTLIYVVDILGVVN